MSLVALGESTLNIRELLKYLLKNMQNYLNRVDSEMLVEEGFEVVSIDASDKMLKYALRARWERRREMNFENWGMLVE